MSSHSNIGLPIDDSEHGLPPLDSDDNNDVADYVNSAAARAVKAELRRKVDALKEQLQAATEALEKIEKRGGGADNENSERKNFIPPPVEEKKRSPKKASRSATAVAAGNGKSLTTSISKKGYLFKWMDREIGWGGTKWALRFVTLDGGRLSYFGSHTETTAPRYVLNLKGCAVREEGVKRNSRHRSSALARRKGQDPPIDEPGAYFFLFSIYQRKSHGGAMASPYDEADVIPLIRFSTPSMGEKQQWVQLLAEACAYCETEDFLVDEANRANEFLLQQQQAQLLARAMPEAKEGTLPALYFAPAFKPLQRRPSLNKTPDAKDFRSKSKNTDAEGVESRSRKGYPPSKPMHRCAAPSFLSSEAPPQNYRGFFNLGIIILVVSNFRLMLATVRRHGFVVTHFLAQWKEIREIRQDPWYVRFIDLDDFYSSCEY